MKFIANFPGSPDGSRVLTYEKGQILRESTDFPRDLIDVALAEGWAVEYKEAKPTRKKSAKKK